MCFSESFKKLNPKLLRLKTGFPNLKNVYLVEVRKSDLRSRYGKLRKSMETN